MRKFWIFMLVLFLIAFSLAVGCAASDSFKTWFVGSMLGIFGQVGQSVAGWWAGVAATPLYQQWHMLIWFAGGVIGTVIFLKVLWPKRPGVLQKAKLSTPISSYQEQLSTPELYTPPPKTQAPAQVTPKEPVKAEKEVEAE